MRPRSLLVLLLWVVGGPAPEPAHSETVTEAVFLDAVDAAHPAARALAGDLGAAEARRLGASLLEDPRLELEREAPGGAERETTWSIAWTPPIDGRRRGAVSAAETGVEREAHRLEARLLELRSEVREAYAAWTVSEARAALLFRHGGRLEELAKRTRRRAEAGEDSLLAARRMEIAFGSSRAALSQARAAQAAWRERAAAWLPDGIDLSPVGAQLPELREAPGDLARSLADVASARPDVLAARSEVERAEHLERLSRRVVGAPELAFGWKSIESDPGVGDLEGPVFAIGWTVPVFDRRRADRLAAGSVLEAAAAGEEWLSRRARGELAAALAAYGELRQAALAAQNDLEGLEEVARAATASFEAGESTVSDLLGTLRDLLDARLTALDLYAAALHAHRQLEVAAGRPLSSGDPS